MFQAASYFIITYLGSLCVQRFPMLFPVINT